MLCDAFFFYLDEFFLIICQTNKDCHNLFLTFLLCIFIFQKNIFFKWFLLIYSNFMFFDTFIYFVQVFIIK
jgi:hypothetical protein